MARLSVSDAWTRAARFVMAERALLGPVALLFFGLPMALLPFAFGQRDLLLTQQSGQLPPGAWALLPVLLMNLLGWMTITALQLVPGLTVADAIGRGLKRLWVPIAASTIQMAVLVAAMVVLSMIAIGLAGAGAAGVAQGLAVLLVLIASLLFFAISILVVPQAVTVAAGPVTVLKRAWAMSHGARWRLLAVVLLFVVVAMLANAIASILFGIIGIAIARALAMPELALVLTSIVVGMVGAAVYLLFYALGAELYRTLASASQGSSRGI